MLIDTLMFFREEKINDLFTYCLTLIIVPLTTIETGITIKMHVKPNDGIVTWKYFEKASTVDPEEGQTKEMESEYDISLD